MLSQLNKLDRQTDGRYASDAELIFINEYTQSFSLRMSAYCKLQSTEQQIMQQLKARLLELDPALMEFNNPEINTKCQRDLLFVFRCSAIALLFNDTDLLQEKVLFWLQTIMRSFKEHQQRCDMIYKVMQDVVKQFLTPAEASLFCPILELNRSFLGVAS